jgi:heme exporter protein B
VSGYGALLGRELRLALRAGGGAAQGLAFFFILVLLVPLGVGPDPEVLGRIAPGVIWIGALLACLLSLDRLFLSDAEDGTLDILVLSPLPLSGLVAVKALAHWLTTGLPLTVIAPVLALMLNLSVDVLPWMVLTLACGTPALSFIGAVGAALTLGLRRGGLILSVLVLPLYVPTLVFGALSIISAQGSRDPLPTFALMGGITLFCLVLCPPVTAAILRIQLR